MMMWYLSFFTIICNISNLVKIIMVAIYEGLIKPGGLAQVDECRCLLECGSGVESLARNLCRASLDVPTGLGP
jgi:hypothetical protein